MTFGKGRTLPRLLVALVVVVAGLLAWGAVSLTAGDQPAAAARSSVNGGEWFLVEPRSFDLTVVASGELEAKKQVEVKSEVSSRLSIIEVIDEGSFVEKGDVLCKLDPAEIEDKVEREVLEVEQARADFVSAEQTLAIEQNEAASARRAAEVKLALAELDLAKWEKGEVEQKRRELALALEKAERRLERAKTDLTYSEELLKRKFISQSEYDDDLLELTEAEAALMTAQLNIDVYDNYAFKRDQKQKMSDLEQARGELERTIRKNESKLARLQADLDSKRRSLKIREDRLAELRKQLEATVIKAPQEGLVVYATSVGPHWRRNDPVAPGKQIRFNETIFILPDTRQMMAVLRVHEAQLPQVEVGQSANVTVDARPGSPLPGKVTTLAVMAEDGGWLNPQLREYKVKAELPQGADATLKPGMRCTGEIHIGRVEDALAVPVQAVFTEGTEQFVYLPTDNGGVRRQPVSTGRANEAFVEIVDGVSPGDQVLLRNPRPGELAGSA